MKRSSNRVGVHRFVLRLVILPQWEERSDVPAASKSSSFWADAMASDGFVVECIRRAEGERFGIISVKQSMFAGLHQIPTDSFAKRTSSPIADKNYWVSGPLTEADVRSRLMEAGLSTSDIDAKLEWARQWATTITSRDRPPDEL
jgi:hypothetical protein